MGRPKVPLSLRVDGDVSRALDIAVEKTGYSRNELATRLIREGLDRKYRQEIAESMYWAGMGTAALCVLLLLSAWLA